MKAQVKAIADVVPNGSTINFNIILDSSYAETVYKVQRGVSEGLARYFINLEKETKRRSLNANAYLWVLCDKIAKEVGSTKETVYRKNIREVGSFDVVEVRNGEALGRFIQRWEANGLGNLAEPLGPAREGFTNVIAYYGSSSYDSKEMSVLLEAVVSEAQGLGIETLEDRELKELEASWRGNN